MAGKDVGKTAGQASGQDHGSEAGPGDSQETGRDPPGDSEFAALRREHSDPDERVRPLPWFFTMFLGAMGMWGAFYIVAMPSGEASAYGD